MYPNSITDGIQRKYSPENVVMTMDYGTLHNVKMIEDKIETECSHTKCII